MPVNPNTSDTFKCDIQPGDLADQYTMVSDASITFNLDVSGKYESAAEAYYNDPGTNSLNVGCTCVPLEKATVEQAVELGGGEGGELLLSQKQLLDLLREDPEMNPSTCFGSLSLSIVANIEIINAGADHLGIYVGPKATVGICSRANPGDCRSLDRGSNSLGKSGK